MPEPAHHW